MRLPSPTLCLLPFLFLTLLQRPTFASIKPYVVYFGGHSHGPKPSSLDANLAKDSHYEFLGSFLGSREFAEDAIFYSYTRHINGFAATLEDEVAAEIASEKPLLLLLCFSLCFVSFVIFELSSLSNAEHPRVVSVFLNQGRKQHTTHSWSFLGLEKDGVVPSSSIWKKARFGEDTIIGNLDTVGSFQECGRSRKALAMKGWDRFHQSGMEHVKMAMILASTATGIFLCLLTNYLCKSCVHMKEAYRSQGESLSAKALPRNKFFPLMSAADARATNASVENALLCKDGSLDPEKAKGKILVCLRGINARVDKGQQAALAGAVGMVLANNKDAGNEILADPHVLPMLVNVISEIQQLFLCTQPDITAPGVSVIAAFTKAQGPTNQDFDTRRISTFSDAPYECPSKPISLANFNYPSITVPNFNGSITLSRTVKNVGSPSTYKLRIRKPTGVSVSVEPKKLEFKKVGEEKAFTVTLKGKGKAAKDYVFGELIWSDNKHHVRSPIVVKWF
ncbi:hypothetical protein POTOM_061745 [Populus tomentosa]|uniref:Subtilisin-like protease SBT5.3 n=1 Tax=Populus tomentosa TaxID=118781 RepID=A0A8X7XM40_POPTO|nr:hypothetical protein POTOM_061745 [Populus tomentosa]